MIPYLGHLVKFASHKNPSTVSLLCDLHHYYLRNFLLFAITFGFCRQIFGDSIVCHIDRQSLSEAYLETTCFINGTFSVTQDRGTIHHGYYQWISVWLILEALLSYAPYHVWLKCVSHKIPSLTDHGEGDDKSAMELLTYIRVQGAGEGLFWKHLLLECAYGCNILLQAFFADFALNGGIRKGTPFPLLFPLTVKCNVDYFSGGDVTSGKFQCLLPLNVLYLPIFRILCWTWIALGVLHAIHLPYRLLTSTCVALRRGPFWENVNAWWMYGQVYSSENSKGARQLERCLKAVDWESKHLGMWDL